MQTLQTFPPFHRVDMCQISISSIFDVIKHVGSDEKDLVSGFIRQHITNSPELITVTCLWFYFQIKHETYTIVESFDAMNLKDNLLRGIYSYGFEQPSAIQQRAILPIIKRNDVIVQAQAGTGKTSTFQIAGLQIMDMEEPQCQLLMIMPTRELTINSHNVLKHIGEYLKVTTHSAIGGRSIRDDINSLKNGVQSIAGTPGRMSHLLSRGVLKADKVKLCILDEADECLSSGFKEQIDEIMQYLPPKAQICCFSATMPKEVLSFSQKYLKNPIKIMIKKDELTLDGIKQFYVGVEKEEWKLETLYDLYECLNISQSIIYCNSRRKTMWLKEKLLSKDFTVSAIHYEMSQNEREIYLKQFRSGETRILITTDLMSRGIDAHTMKYSVSLVISYDLPSVLENYIYRIGRAGKYGRKGVSIHFVTADESQRMRDIEAYYNTTIEELPMDIDSII